MRRAGAVVYEVLHTLREMVAPGVTTRMLDEKALELTKKHRAKPAFLHYKSPNSDTPPFPGVICSSRNEVIVHGIPDDLPLKEGDIISIDYGCVLNGFYGDSAITVAVGQISPLAERLLSATKDSLQLAIEQCVAGNRIGDISHAVQNRVEKEGFSVVREFVGHGIGRAMHEPPAVPNFGPPKQGRALRAGMTLAIEPMVTVGAPEAVVLEDGWTAVSRDRSLAAHFEHTVAITDGKPVIITLP
jgi:methionyl aminopeptidase